MQLCCSVAARHFSNNLLVGKGSPFRIFHRRTIPKVQNTHSSNEKAGQDLFHGKLFVYVRVFFRFFLKCDVFSFEFLLSATFFVNNEFIQIFRLTLPFLHCLSLACRFSSLLLLFASAKTENKTRQRQMLLLFVLDLDFFWWKRISFFLRWILSFNNFLNFNKGSYVDVHT